MLAKIQAYESKLLECPAAFFPPLCPTCQESRTLRVHELRRREFWFCLAQEVKRVVSVVLRVVCKACNHRTTVLPGFALPHKRYLLAVVSDASELYLLDDSATYESAARSGGQPLFHDSEGSALARSTVHRWIGFLGSLVLLLGSATALLREADPTFSPLVEMRDISARRYRSETRRECLERAHRLLRVRSRLLKAINIDLFPRIATAAAWT